MSDDQDPGKRHGATSAHDIALEILIPADKRQEHERRVQELIRRNESDLRLREADGR